MIKGKRDGNPEQSENQKCPSFDKSGKGDKAHVIPVKSGKKS